MLRQTSSLTPGRSGLQKHSVYLSVYLCVCHARGSNLQPQLPGVVASSAPGAGEDPSFFFRCADGELEHWHVPNYCNPAQKGHIGLHSCMQGKATKPATALSTLSALGAVLLFVRNKTCRSLLHTVATTCPCCQPKQTELRNDIAMYVSCLHVISAATKRACFTHLIRQRTVSPYLQQWGEATTLSYCHTGMVQ